MYKVFLLTAYFLEEYLIKDVFTLIKKTPLKVDDGLFEIEFKELEALINDCLNLIHYSRTLDYIFLSISNFKKIEEINIEDFSLFTKNNLFMLDCLDDSLNKIQLNQIKDKIEKFSNLSFGGSSQAEFEFEVFKLKDTYYLVLNLFGDSLTRRDYLVNAYEDSINSLFINYALYKLNINEEERFSLIDTNAQLGEVIIESSFFNKRKPLFIKDRRNLPISKLFKINLFFEDMPKDKNNLTAIVQDSSSFKYLKENISFSSQKIKISQFDLDWFDVKYHKGDFDYLLSVFLIFDSKEEQLEYEKQFFYQAEFIIKKKIGVFSQEKLFLNCLSEFNLKLESNELLKYEDQEFYFYIIEHDKKNKDKN